MFRICGIPRDYVCFGHSYRSGFLCHNKFLAPVEILRKCCEYLNFLSVEMGKGTVSVVFKGGSISFC